MSELLDVKELMSLFKAPVCEI